MQHVFDTLDGAVDSVFSATSMRWMPPELAVLVSQAELNVDDAARSLGLPSEAGEIPERAAGPGEPLPLVLESCYPPGAVSLEVG